MKNAYPIFIHKDGEFYLVYIPDFDVNTEGHTIPDAIEMARDAIGLLGISYYEDKVELPKPSALEDLTVPDEAIVTLVDVDFDAYRRKHERRTVRKNVSIPSWLNEAAESADINFSALLQNALKNELGIFD